MQIIGQGAQATQMEIRKQLSKECLKNIGTQSLIRSQTSRVLNQYIFILSILQQAKIIQKLYKKGMKVPRLYKLDLQNYKIQMQFIEGQKLKNFFNCEQIGKEQKIQVLQRLGQLVYRLHGLGVIHGDLTTSNMMYQEGQIYLIDFGLSYIKSSIEDRAVDLYVLERAFTSTHPQLENQFPKLLIAYNQQAVLKRLEVVRQRGRKKVAFG